MIALFVTSLCLVVLMAVGIVWLLDRSHARVVKSLEAQNLDLLNRLYVSRGQPPTGTNMSEKYEERQTELQQRKETSNSKVKSVPSFIKKVTAKDRQDAERGLNVT